MCSSLTFAPRGDKKQVEEGVELAPKFDDKGLITAIAVDAATNDILMVAYMNQEALSRTIELGEAVYFSRSRGKLWHKGEESGNVQKVKEIRIDCDQDALVLKVEQVGGAACHTGYRSCFFRKLDLEARPQGQAPQLAVTEAAKVFDPQQVYKK